MKRIFIIHYSLFIICLSSYAQTPVSLDAGSYASYVPLTKSKTSEHGGCQAYWMEHRRLYLPDSLLVRLGTPDGSREGSLALPTNDWWTYALVNTWTGKLWFYPGWAEAKDGELTIGYPDHWEPTGNEVKWDTPLAVSFTNTATGRKAAFKEALVDSWSDFAMSFIMQDGGAWIRVTCMHGSPLVWIESSGIAMTATNPNAAHYAVFEQPNCMTVALLTDGLDAASCAPYAFQIPRKTTFSYSYDAATSSLTTTFHVSTDQMVNDQMVNDQMVNDQMVNDQMVNVLVGFLPHQYFDNQSFILERSGLSSLSEAVYFTPRGTMRLYEGNDFTFTYPVHPFLPFFPAPMEWDSAFSETRMNALNADYAKRGSFGGDTYWGGKGLTQMAHYMTFALQMGDTATFLMAKKRLKETLVNWYTFTPGEERFYFARYPKWGALIGMDPSYDSDTFNDHHFHYGYFVYASALLCLLDDDFRTNYGAMAREVVRDYANWQRSADEPWFRTLDPYCGHSFAGGMGNGGNGNGQESTSEAIQGWGGVWLLGAALQDQEMLEAGIMGYTLETRATAEYWFDKKRRNIDFTKYNHPYCCNLTMQGVGWWTWFSGDPVWMHSIQWLPISPILTNCFSEDLPFARWDYTEMYTHKEVGDYEAATGGLGDESGLGNVCLSYLSLFDADSAIHVWDRMDAMGKPLAKNPDTGGITYWLAHSHKSLGEKRYDILASHPMACAYTDTLSGRTTYAVYSVAAMPISVHFFGAVDTTVTVPHGLTLIAGSKTRTVTTIEEEEEIIERDSMAWDLPYPNLALHKPVTASSYENAGCQPINLTDGDPKTRWGSTHHDGEWVQVDLGEVCYIDHIVLRWEAAYASEYELAFSNDGSIWHSAIFSSAGGVETISSPLHGGIEGGSRARYIRLTGLQRATSYGTSLYEVEAYGRPLTGDPNRLFTVTLSATDSVLMQGESTTLISTAYSYAGNVIFTSREQITYPDYGLFTETRTFGNCSASFTIVVMESERVDSAVVYPSEVTLPLGDAQQFTICPINQFGIATDTCFEEFRATEIGDTTLYFDCHAQEVSALVHVLAYTDVNLALHKPVLCSGYENAGTTPEGAVDGDLKTRWGSRHQDDEWLEVDLEHCYVLDSVRIYWEAAYAMAYEILVSDDAISYESVYSTTTCKGKNETIALSSVNARFVRLLCHSRATGYGSSIYEIEIFGSGRCDQEETLPNLQIFKFLNHKFIYHGQMYISRNGIIYSLSGSQCVLPKE